MILHASILTLAVVVASPALADPIADAQAIANAKNPLGAALLSPNFGCYLLGPPSDQFDLTGSPGPGAAGTITVPKLLADNSTYDLDTSGELCQLPDDTKVPNVKDYSSIKGGVETISFTNDISAQLKLTMGTWLNLIDFDAEDLSEVDISIAVEPYVLSQPKLRVALLNMRKAYPGNTCAAISDPKVEGQAQQIVRSCYGMITVGLVAKKDLTLNALDLKFANLTVGLKASWIRDVKGGGTDCTGPGAVAGGAGDGAAAPPAPATPTEAAASSSDATKNGVPSTIRLPTGTVSIVPALLDILANQPTIKMGAPTQADVDKSVQKSQNPNATPDAVQKAKTATDAAKSTQPEENDKKCAQNVLYRTSDVLIVGAYFLDKKTTSDNLEWLKLQH
jgi:hypothetical protein